GGGEGGGGSGGGAGGRLWVGSREAAGTELGSTEVAHDGDEDVGHAGGVDRRRDRLSGRARGFTVVRRAAAGRVARTDFPGGRDVRRVVILAPPLPHFLRGALGVLDPHREGEKTGAPFAQRSSTEPSGDETLGHDPSSVRS